MQRVPADEESRGLLRKIVEGHAYRQLMLANIRGHGIKYLPELDQKLVNVRRLADLLPPVQVVIDLYAEIDGGDLVSAVRDRMERIPYPTSRLELAVCLFLCMRAERHALEAYADCRVSSALAELSRARLALVATGDLPRDGVFVDYCSDPANRPHAQQMLNRWLALCLVALGRPGSTGDARAVALGLRSRHAADIAAEFLAGLQPFLDATGLAVPEAGVLGVELPQLAARKS
jgi:1,2-phenylacetyl-CoA epoxidase catalytic subunit